MKDQVIEALRSSASKPKEKFQKLFDLYRKHPEANATLSRHFNATGFTGENLSSLEYEIQKLFNISATMLKGKPKHNVEKQASKPTEKTPEEKLLELDPKASEEDLLAAAHELADHFGIQKMVVEDVLEFSKGKEGTEEMKKWLADRKVDHSFSNKKDLGKLIKEVQAEQQKESDAGFVKTLFDVRDSVIEAQHAEARNIVVKTFTEAPEEVKEGLKLREEFPFLNNEDCPDVLKIAVADKLTAYNKFLETRAEIKKAIESGATNEELFELGKTAIDSFKLNRDLYKELDYYKEHGELLAEAQGFEAEAIKEQVANYSTLELTKRKKNLNIYIGRENKVLAGMDAGEVKDELQKKVDAWQFELDLVLARLEKIS